MILLDDQHWADKPSLLLLEFLGQELGDASLLVVGTYRDVDLSRRHPLAETLGELTRQEFFHRVTLKGLSRDEVARFIQATSGIEPEEHLVETLHSHTEGNPLFVSEVVRMLEQEGELASQSPGGVIGIPEGVREVIGRRLNRLSEQCVQVLTVASVVGREFGLDQLGRIVDDLPQDWLLEVLEEAAAARVIEEVPRATGRYQFAHALMRQTLAEELSTTRRLQLHARIAEALEELYAGVVETHATELAYHFGEAEEVLGSEKLARYSLMAGERALATYAWEDALGHFSQALAAKGSGAESQRPIDAEAAEILSGVGRAQLAMLQVHQWGDAIANLRRAFDFYAEAGDVARSVAVAIYLNVTRGGHQPAATELIPRALKLVQADSHEAACLLSRYAGVLGLGQGDYEGAQEAIDQALEIARREADTDLEMVTLAIASMVEVFHLRLQDAVDRGLRAIALEQVNDPFYQVARLYGGIALAAMGNPAEARLSLDACLRSYKKTRNRYRMAIALGVRGWLSMLEGDWESARNFIERGRSLEPQDTIILGFGALLDVARLTSPGSSHEYSGTAKWVPMAARISSVVERLGIAEDAAGAVLSSRFATPLMARGGLGRAGAYSSAERRCRRRRQAVRRPRVTEGHNHIRSSHRSPSGAPGPYDWKAR